MTAKAWHAIANVITGEWMLKFHANGGNVIAARSLWVALPSYGLAAVLHSWASAKWSFHPDLSQAGIEIEATLPWLGAIFGAVYVALYARFSAQWSYLAGLYNEIMKMLIEEERHNSMIESDPVKPGLLRSWRRTSASRPRPAVEQPAAKDLWLAAFVEDAMTLHLATKTLFAELIWHLLEEEGVRLAFDESVTSGGAPARERLQKRLRSRFPGLQPAT